MVENTIYLDNAATTFPKPEIVYERMDRVNRELAVNAGRGGYKMARAATEIIDDTKAKLLKLVHATNDEFVVFSPSITIALNQILNGIDFKQGDVIYISPYEHNAVARVVEKIRNDYGVVVKLMPVSKETQEINEDLLKDMILSDKPKCVCCTHVSNVTGYILPVEDIFSVAKDVGAITVLDTAQSLGLIDVRMENVDFLAFAGHKALYGPLGIGGFITNGKVQLRQFIVGGTGSNSLSLSMPEKRSGRYESASSNIVAIAGLQAALEEVINTSSHNTEADLLQYARTELTKLYGVKLYVPQNTQKHVSVISFNVQGYTADDIGQILDQEYNIAVRTGYHCAPYVHELLGDIGYSGTVRIGIGKFNTKEDIDTLCSAIEELVM